MHIARKHTGEQMRRSSQAGSTTSSSTSSSNNTNKRLQQQQQAEQLEQNSSGNMKAMEITSKETEVRPNSILDVKVDASFRKIAKNAICFHVWKIDEDRLEGELKSQYGSFYDDCAYIVYAAGPVGSFVTQDTITRETKPSVTLERFIHFWLGEKVSEQKRSNVAHKIQELDSYFNNMATEYRETQNNESARFLSYFKKGLTILSSDLIGSKETNRLYQLHGRKWLRCVEMPNIGWEHFGSDYIMLLKTDAHCFVWIGRSSSTAERRIALDWVYKMQPNAAFISIVDDGYEQSMPEKLKTIWNDLLPLNKRVVSQVSPIVEKQQVNKLKIYKCGYRGARLHLDQLDVVIPTREDMNDNTTTYVLDAFNQGVWLWVGTQAPHQDKISAMGNGRAFVKKKKYPYSTPVIRVVQGHEPIEFIRLFPSWPQEGSELSGALKPSSTFFGKLDAVTLAQRPKLAAATQLIDDGSGERKIFRVTKDQVYELPPSKATIFTTNNCYVVQYSVAFSSANSTDAQCIGVNTIVYQWNGSDANADDVIKCERYAINCFENSRESAMLVQMCEYDETPHFLQIFDGKLIILQSDKNIHNGSNGFNGNGNGNNMNYMDKQMTALKRDCFVLKMYGDTSCNSKAVEVFPLTSMSSKECYVVKTSHVWVWCGQSSTGDAREMAKHVGNMLGESSLIMEGKEPKEFWRSITSHMNQPLITNGSSLSPNQTNYMNSNIGANKLRFQPQLFVVWMQNGKFFSQEVYGFEQSDLLPECAHVLDTGNLTYVWLGKHAPSIDSEKYVKLAQCYLETVPIARRPTTAVAIIRQNSEPNTFKGLFENWNPNYWDNYISYEDKRELVAQHTESHNGNGRTSINGDNGKSALPPALRNHQKEFDRHHKYPIGTLQQEIDLLPAEVNPLKREVHLTHDDFVSLFSMTFWEFDELPAWKKQELKKKYKLF